MGRGRAKKVTGGTTYASGVADDSGTPTEPRQYRMEELARLAGITVRTLRFYRERKLIPPPRREGRIAWYDDHHLARLRTISGLLARGHTLGGIADLLGAFESGRDSHGTAELLGMESSMITTLFAEESPIRLTPEELADYYQGEVTVENLAASLDLGYLATDGTDLVHISRRLLETSAALVREGIPLADILSAARRVREHADALAELFTGLALTRGASPADLERLRPLAKSVVEAELSMALDRRVREAEQRPPGS